jgi:hypothetical protein
MNTNASKSHLLRIISIFFFCILSKVIGMLGNELNISKRKKERNRIIFIQIKKLLFTVGLRIH